VSDLTPVAILKAQFSSAALMLDRCEANLRRRCDRGSVHALRVALRRTRALLWSVKPWIKRDCYRVLAQQLKSISRQLAPQRDIDVLADTLMTQVASKARLSSAEQRLLSEDIRLHRVKVRRNLLAATRSVEYRQRSRKVRELLAGGPALFRKSVPTTAVPWKKRILRGVARFDRLLHRAGRRDLHRVRIRAKRCRYSLEALGPDAPRRSLHHMKSIQTSLGCYCDARLAAEWLQLQAPLHDRALRKRLLRAARTLVKQRATAALRALR
jgi:CHAD domain-containing protein